jgi:hypothetical protein
VQLLAIPVYPVAIQFWELAEEENKKRTHTKRTVGNFGLKNWFNFASGKIEVW